MSPLVKTLRLQLGVREAWEGSPPVLAQALGLAWEASALE